MEVDAHMGKRVVDDDRAVPVYKAVAEAGLDGEKHDGIVGPAPVLGMLSQVESRAITVNQQRCAKVRNRNVECLKCAAACTSGCISYADNQLSIDPSKCVGCGTCATVCPTCALESRNPTDGELLRASLNARQGDTVVLACQPLRRALEGKFSQDALARVVCLGRVDESLLADLAARGVTDIQLACGDCTQCAQAHGKETANLVAETANQLFEFWDCSTRVSVVENMPGVVLEEGVNVQDADAAVKAYFAGGVACDLLHDNEASEAEYPTSSAVSGQSAWASDAHAGADATPVAPVVDATGHEVLPAFAFAPKKHADKLQDGLLRVMKDGTLPHFLPDRRERLLDNLAQLGEPKEGTLNTRLWGCVVIDGGKCTSCRMCATFCPTGAIRKFDNADGTFGVDHYPGDCVKCGSCRDICPSQAIVLLDEVKPNYLVDGSVHHYAMRNPEVAMGDAHQILNTMRARMAGTNIFER